MRHSAAPRLLFRCCMVAPASARWPVNQHMTYLCMSRLLGAQRDVDAARMGRFGQMESCEESEAVPAVDLVAWALAGAGDPFSVSGPSFWRPAPEHMGCASWSSYAAQARRSPCWPRTPRKWNLFYGLDTAGRAPPPLRRLQTPGVQGFLYMIFALKGATRMPGCDLASHCFGAPHRAQRALRRGFGLYPRCMLPPTIYLNRH